jgi:hypothetical protein
MPRCIFSASKDFQRWTRAFSGFLGISLADLVGLGLRELAKAHQFELPAARIAPQYTIELRARLSFCFPWSANRQMYFHARAVVF